MEPAASGLEGAANLGTSDVGRYGVQVRLQVPHSRQNILLAPIVFLTFAPVTGHNSPPWWCSCKAESVALQASSASGQPQVGELLLLYQPLAPQLVNKERAFHFCCSTSILFLP